MSPTIVAGYLALFFVIGALFLFINLLVGRFLRPKNPNDEKLSVYECGEPTIGSSFVQFDLRFYVVALLFIIFDVEVAFFFPWATVYGKATHLTDPNFAVVHRRPRMASPTRRSTHIAHAAAVQRELGVQHPSVVADVHARTELTAGLNERRPIARDRPLGRAANWPVFARPTSACSSPS